MNPLNDEITLAFFRRVQPELTPYFEKFGFLNKISLVAARGNYDVILMNVKLNGIDERDLDLYRSLERDRVKVRTAIDYLRGVTFGAPKQIPEIASLEELMACIQLTHRNAYPTMDVREEMFKTNHITVIEQILSPTPFPWLLSRDQADSMRAEERPDPFVRQDCEFHFCSDGKTYITDTRKELNYIVTL